MMERRGFRIDRRSGVDRRKIHDLNYFIRGGVERRKFIERRSPKERRKKWVRVDEWISVFVGDPVRQRHKETGGSKNIKEKNGLSSDTKRQSMKKDCHGDQLQDLCTSEQ
jgi:hypothetical protein